MSKRSSKSDQEISVWALHSFVAQEPDEINGFEIGDKLIVYEKDEGFNDGWWKGRCLRTGDIGLFPSNFVSLKQDEAEKMREKKLASLEALQCSPSSNENLSLSQYQQQQNLFKAKPPSEWTVEDVSNWLGTLDGFEQYREKFREHEMDGNALISPFLDLNALKELGIHALERRLYFLGQISKLRSASLENHVLPPPTPIPDLQNSLSSGKKSISSAISSAAISRKSPFRQLKPRSQTVDVTPMVPQDIRTLADVLKMSCDGHLENSDYHGYLYKRGGHAHWSWKKRYFILKHMTLWYFKSYSYDAKVLGLIILPSYQILPASNTNVKNGIFTFVASHPDARTYWFKAETVNEMTGWMNAMVRASLGLPVCSSSSESLRKSGGAHNNFYNVVASPAVPENNQSKPSPPVNAKTISKLKSNTPNNLVLVDSDITQMMDTLVKHVKDLHTQGRRFPASTSLLRSKSTSSGVKTTTKAVKDFKRRETILETVNLKTSMEYVLWINCILFSSDTIVISPDEGDETEVNIPPPPNSLEPIKHLHLDITDGIHLIDFILRLVAREHVRENYQTHNVNELSDAIERMFDHYRQLTIPKPNFRVQMLDNLQNVWRILKAEFVPYRFDYWLKNDSCDLSDGNEDPEIMKRLDKLGITPDGIYQGNLEQILLLMNEIERVFPMEDDGENET